MKNLILMHLGQYLDTFDSILDNPRIDLEVVSVDDHYLCDVATGYRVLNRTDKIIFKDVEPEVEHFLKLKFGSDIEECAIEDK